MNGENQKLRAEKLELREQLTPFITIATQYYPTTEANSLGLLAQRIGGLELDLITLPDYQEAATWSFTGRVVLSQSKDSMISAAGQASGWTNGFISDDDTIRCDNEARDHYLNQIDLYPLFPFPYYVLSTCLKNVNDDGWLTYTEKAIQILRKTTQMPNHHPDHDAILALLEGR